LNTSEITEDLFPEILKKEGYVNKCIDNTTWESEK
jgi:hypothetical protein